MLNIDKIRKYCLSKNGTTEDMPFGDDTLVFKVAGKMFGLVNLEGELRMNLKCDPEKAIELRASYPENVIPGYHMNKKHWNTIILNREIDDNVVLRWIDESYILVFDKLPKKDKESIAG
jgi:predicted DNA-binding protein (MmcQ/YjbR family)